MYIYIFLEQRIHLSYSTYLPISRSQNSYKQIPSHIIIFIRLSLHTELSIYLSLYLIGILSYGSPHARDELPHPLPHPPILFPIPPLSFPLLPSPHPPIPPNPPQSPPLLPSPHLSTSLTPHIRSQPNLTFISLPYLLSFPFLSFSLTQLLPRPSTPIPSRTQNLNVAY